MLVAGTVSDCQISCCRELSSLLCLPPCSQVTVVEFLDMIMPSMVSQRGLTPGVLGVAPEQQVGPAAILQRHGGREPWAEDHCLLGISSSNTSSRAGADDDSLETDGHTTNS
jgi:hypothetical protein